MIVAGAVGFWPSSTDYDKPLDASEHSQLIPGQALTTVNHMAAQHATAFPPSEPGRSGSRGAGSPAARKHNPGHAHQNLARLDVDITYTPVDFTVREISALQAQGKVEVSLPDAQLTLLLASATQQSGVAHLHAHAAGLTSTITHAEDSFFATVATPNGVWRIHGQDNQAWGTKHAHIAMQRQLIAQDYRIAEYRHVE